jgi:beta-glucanase (GH16 family)
MKEKFIIIVLAGLFIVPVFSQNPPTDKNWETVFVDGFKFLNTNFWTVQDNFDHYGAIVVFNKQNVYTSNGNLVLETKKEPYCCPPQHVGEWGCKRQWLTGNCYQYTSGYVVSKTLYKYGYFEMYAKLPGSSGYFPAFWLHGSGENLTNNNCWSNEIDIFEAYGSRIGAVESNAWYGFKCEEKAKEIGAIPHACNYTTGYHWYGMEWDRNKITWYVDRKAVRQITNNMEGIGIQNAMKIIINTGLNSNITGDNIISNNTIFPNYMYVDQLNHYKLKYDCKTVVNEISNYNTFNYAVKKSISLSGASSLSSGQNVSLRATNFIELNAGFEVPTGAELYLDINPCE